MADFFLYIVAGATVGFIVGLTGIGGGALMTPLLLLFGFPPATAIGTDLMYAGITKASGAWAHFKQGHVQWNILKPLMAGSISATIITGWALHHLFDSSEQYSHVLTSVLGVMLLVTATVILFRSVIQKWSSGLLTNGGNSITTITFISGAVLGTLVTLSSVGAGAIGTALLMILYPTLKSGHVVGTDIVHAVPLTLIAGFIHLYLGHVDFMLLGALLLGSIPAIQVSSRLAKRLPDEILRRLLASLLLLLGLKYALF